MLDDDTDKDILQTAYTKCPPVIHDDTYGLYLIQLCDEDAYTLKYDWLPAISHFFDVVEFADLVTEEMKYQIDYGQPVDWTPLTNRLASFGRITFTCPAMSKIASMIKSSKIEYDTTYTTVANSRLDMVRVVFELPRPTITNPEQMYTIAILQHSLRFRALFKQLASGIETARQVPHHFWYKVFYTSCTLPGLRSLVAIM
jgi:hypothetical protein